MDFQDLLEHLGSAVQVDHLEEEAHFARNCISGGCCVIENLPVYSDVTLCHYFYCLGVSEPSHLNETMEHYRMIRENAVGITAQVNKDS